MPKLLKTPFAVDAAEGFRTDIQESTGAAPNSATYQVGFPPVTMQSIASNGMPPKGSDLNGVLYDITDNLVFLTQGGGYGFDSAYATSIGGYPLNARLRLTNGDIVKSTVDANTNDPNVDMTGWVKETSIQTVESVSDILTVNNPQLGQTVLAKSISSVTKNGGGFYQYNGSEWDLIPLAQLRLSSFGDTSDTIVAFTRLFAYIQALPTTLSENGQPIRKITIDLEGLTWNLTTSVFGVQGIGGLRFTNGTIRADDGFVGDYLCEFTDEEALRAYHFITFDNIIFDANYKTSCFRINRALKCGFSTCHFLRWKENGYGLVVGKTPTDTLGATQEAHEVFVNCGSTFAQYDFSAVWGGQVCSGTALYINTYDGHYSDFVISYTGRGIEHIRTGLNIFDNIHIYGAEEKDYGFFIDCTNVNPFVNINNIYMDECSIRALNPNQIIITDSKIFRNDQSTRGLIIFDTTQQYVDASRIVMANNHFNTSTNLGKKQVEFVTESGGAWGSSAGSLIKSHSNTYLGYVEPIETGSDVQDIYKYEGFNLTKRYALDESGTFTLDMKKFHNKNNGQNVSASCSEWLITSNWQATSGNGVGVFRLVVFLMSSGQYVCTVEPQGVGYTSTFNEVTKTVVTTRDMPFGFKSNPVVSTNGVLTVELADFCRGAVYRSDTRPVKVIN